MPEDSNQSPEALNNLGIRLGEEQQLTKAIGAFRQALALRPNFPEALNNLGNALLFDGQFEGSIAAFHQAIALRPDWAQAHYNLGAALEKAGQVEPAMAAFRKAIEMQPDFAEAKTGLALLCLLVGDYAQGFALWEARAAMQARILLSGLTKPLWDGSPLFGRRILLHHEQGLGDTIFYVRYARLVNACGGRTIIRCQAALKRLLTGQPGIDEVIDENDAIPEHDLHCPLASLPLRLRTTPQTIPNQVPYLQADPALAAAWRRRLADLPRRINIGLVWAGNAQFRHDRNRSVSLAMLSPLAGINGARFISLQKGPPAQQLQQAPAGLELVDWSNELHDFADTAALVSNLDSIVSVDTAVAHLAGALGKPVGLLVPFAPDWRWMLGRANCPWYPTFRLFRARQPNRWEEAIQEMAHTLRAIVMHRAQ